MMSSAVARLAVPAPRSQPELAVAAAAAAVWPASLRLLAVPLDP